MNLLTIAKWELKKTKTTFSRKTLILSAFIIILISLSSSVISEFGFQPNTKIYTIGVTDPNLAQILKTDPKFDVYLLNEVENGFDIIVIDKNVIYYNTEKSMSALDSLEKAILKYDESRLLAYNDINNTFPVWIKIENRERKYTLQTPTIQNFPEIPEIEKTNTPTQIPTPFKPQETANIKHITTSKEVIQIKEQTLSTPTHFNPPIPFKAVVLTFLFIFPMYFIAQFYSSSIMEERVKRKGELLLVSPVSGFEIVIGKLIPYLVITLLLMSGIALYIGGNLWMLFILLPVSLMFLSTAFMGAIISRSFKEFTYILVFLSVILSGFFIFPAMFANIHEISIISPMTLIVKMLEDNTVSMNEYIFSTLPYFLVSILIFMFGIFIYREEDLFTQKSIKNKLIDSIQVFIIEVKYPVYFLSIVLLPIVFLVQLIMIVFVFNIPLKYGIIIFTFGAAFIEEIIKSVGIYTIFSRKIEKITTKNALKFGFLSGAGFFSGEKILLLIVISGIAGSVYGTVLGIGYLIFPLVLHVTTTIFASLSMRFGFGYWISVIFATLIHASYNLYIIQSFL